MEIRSLVVCFLIFFFFRGKFVLKVLSVEAHACWTSRSDGSRHKYNLLVYN